MNLIFMWSVILKGIGAVLEVLLQVLITKKTGVTGYGNYSTWINAADLLFWVLFSGIVKCNTFYLSVQGNGMTSFKKKYYVRYVLPMLLFLGTVLFLFTGEKLICLLIAMTGMELIFYDRSSTLLARGEASHSLIGEYVLGRFFLILGVWIVGYTGRMTLHALLWLYLCQFILVILFFSIKKENETKHSDISGEVSLKKWGSYQWADSMHSMITQMPVLIQYFSAGAFEAGVVSIVLLVKKLINFISGPTAKIFLPEFSRMYQKNEQKQLREYYGSIMRLQMIFVGPLSVVLLAFPRVVLRILAEELLNYTELFMICSFIFLLTATLGPCGGILQMTGNEKRDNRCRELSLAVMFLTMFLFRQDQLFVLYGLCVQAAVEAGCKYVCVCRWMKDTPVGIETYLKWWILPIISIICAYILHLNDSFLWMFLIAGLLFVMTMLLELKNEDGLRSVLKEKMKGKK